MRGDKLKVGYSDKYADNYDKIFGKSSEKKRKIEKNSEKKVDPTRFLRLSRKKKEK